MNNLAKAGLLHLDDILHLGDMSPRQDQLSSVSVPLQPQLQQRRPIRGWPQKQTGKKILGQELNVNMLNSKQLELRPKLHLRQLHTRYRNHQSLHQWHLLSTHLANIGLSRPRSTEPFFARLRVPPYTTFLPVSKHHLQFQAQWTLHRLLHKPIPIPWHSPGMLSVVFLPHPRLHESQTPFWEHGSKGHRSNSPARCHQHTFVACRPSYEKTAASNWTVSSWPSSHPRFRTIIRWGPTIISEHLQAFLLTAINLMQLASPVGSPFELRQPEGPALASLAETLLDTLQGTMTMDMKMGIATGHIGELVMEGDHRNSRLVFYRTINFAAPSQPAPSSTSPTQSFDDDGVEVWEPGILSCFTSKPHMI